MFFKIGVIVNFPIITRNMYWSLFLNHVLIKLETPTLVFSCEYLKTYKKKNYGTPLVAASENGNMKHEMICII